MRRSLGIALWSLVLLGAAGCTPDLPPGPLRIQITGEEYIWQFRYPGPDGSRFRPTTISSSRGRSYIYRLACRLNSN